MIASVVVGPSFREAEDQIFRAGNTAALVELRLDKFDFSDRRQVELLSQRTALPKIFTLRSRSHGGNYAGGEEVRWRALQDLAFLKPEFIDLECDVPLAVFEKVHSISPDTRIICSYHNFAETPKNLQHVLEGMKNRFSCLYKIAAMGKSTLDALRMLDFLRLNREGKDQLIGITMGDVGAATRILGKIFGSRIAYCPADPEQASAPGQIDAETLKGRYHYNRLTPSTKIFGLIGDPVCRSVSDVTHNLVMEEFGLDAVYVKLKIAKEEVDECIPLLVRLGFQGLSVTMPLKEEVLRWVKEYHPGSREIGAINTLKFSPHGIFGRNTDAAGALDAIEKRLLVKGKKVVIIGAGGAAAAIAYEATARGADVCLVNRTESRAKSLAGKWGFSWGGFQDFKRIAGDGYDVVVNATPVGREGEPFPLAEEMLFGKVAMEVISRPAETPFVLAAKEKGCEIVYGMEMFIGQAVLQFDYWFEGEIDPEKTRSVLEQAVQTAR